MLWHCLSGIAMKKSLSSLTPCLRAWRCSQNMVLVSGAIPSVHTNTIVFTRTKLCCAKKIDQGTYYRANSMCVGFSPFNSSDDKMIQNTKRLHLATALHPLLISFQQQPKCMPWSTQSLRFKPRTSISSARDDVSTLSNSGKSFADESVDEAARDDSTDSRDLSSFASLQEHTSDMQTQSISDLAGRTYNLAPFVERSVTLQSLVRLGVDLSKVEKVSGMADHLVMADFDRDILPHLQHLANVGIEADKLSYIISNNPRLLKVSIDDLEAQVGYLLSKKFSLPDIASMYSRAPILLLMDAVKLDKKLGFLQNIFRLSGHDVRVVALTFPKLLPWRQEKINIIRSTLKEFLGFSDQELRKMIISEPKLFTANRRNMMKAFDYVNNTMMIPHSQIVEWPSILHKRLHIIKSRHLFLLHKGRAQYDPCTENYISMEAMIACNDEKFCQDVAKSDMNEYFDFLKTL